MGRGRVMVREEIHRWMINEETNKNRRVINAHITETWYGGD